MKRDGPRRSGDFWVGVSYSLFGGLAKRLEGRLGGLRAIYDRAGFDVHLRAYLALSLFASLLAAAAAFVAFLLIHCLALGLAPATGALLSLIPSFAASTATMGAFIAAPFYRASQLRGMAEPALPHAANFMMALASAGLPVEVMFERVADVNINPFLTRFARRVIRNIKLLGMDVAAALEEAMRASPSEALNRLVRGLLKVVQTSGDVRSFLAVEGEGLLRGQRDRLRRAVHTLALLGEVYVAFAVVMPVALVIMGVIISMLGGAIMGLDPNMFMFFIVLAGIPALSSIFLIILDSAMARV